MNTRLVTLIVVAVAALGIIGWDIFVAINHTEGDTVSELLLGYARVYKIIPLSFGVLAGHLFWPASGSRFYRAARIAGLASIGVACLALDLLHVVPAVPTIVPMLIGLGLGHFLWPQEEL